MKKYYSMLMLPINLFTYVISDLQQQCYQNSKALMKTIVICLSIFKQRLKLTVTILLCRLRSPERKLSNLNVK